MCVRLVLVVRISVQGVDEREVNSLLVDLCFVRSRLVRELFLI